MRNGIVHIKNSNIAFKNVVVDRHWRTSAMGNPDVVSVDVDSLTAGALSAPPPCQHNLVRFTGDVCAWGASFLNDASTSL